MAVNAQVAKLNGKVTDSLNKPIVYATIIAKPTDSEKSMQFTTTKDNGAYSIELYVNVTYTISVSVLGFKTYVFTHEVLGNSKKDIQLNENVTQLHEVTVEFELPIEIKKDTITYRVDKFVTGEERKLKDVLKKLPGIEVDEDGNVTSQGKKVTHVLVEDKSFFGGNSKLATDNIPADAVKDVEIIDDYNEVSFLKGMTVTDNLALNVKLQEGKKNFVFGDVEAGKGNRNFYKAHANLFYYSPNTNINFLGGLSNIGENIFSPQDYQSFTGGPSMTFNERDIAEQKTISDIVEVTDVTDSSRKIGALNFSKTINKKVDISTYLIYSNSENKTQKETTNDYILSTNSFIENITDSGRISKHTGLGKVKLKYVPNSLEQWSFDILAKGMDGDYETSILSLTDSTEQSFQSYNGSKNIDINGNMEWHKKLSNKHAISTNVNATHDENSSNTCWNTNRAISPSIVPLVPEDIYRLKLLRDTENSRLSVIGKHYFNINTSNLLHTTIGNHYKKSRFITADGQLLSDNTLNNFNQDGFGNDLDFEWNDLYAGLYYNLRSGEFEFHQSVFVHNYSWSLRQTKTINNNKWVVLPDISIRRRSNSSSNLLRFDSRLTSTFSDPSNLASKFYLQSYNSVFQGNENLDNELGHYSSLTYSKSSLLRGSYVLGVLSYKYRINGITNSVDTQNQDRLVSPIRLSEPNQDINGTLIINKATTNFKYKLRAKLNSSKSSRQINDIISEYKSTTGSYKLSVQTINKKLPVIVFGFKQSLGNYGLDKNKFNFVTNEPFVSLDYDFLKKFIFSFDYTYFNYQNKTTDITNTFSLGNTSLSYNKENSPFEFKLSVQNLFGIESKNQNSFNVFVVSDQNTFVLPRIAMLSLIYKL